MNKNVRFLGFNPVLKKKSIHFLKKILDKYNFQLLKKEIESYGYTYSFKNFVIGSLTYVAIILAISFYIRLQYFYILLLIITVLLVFPFLIRSSFKQMYQRRRFEMVIGYLDNLLPVFKRTPIITQTWQQILDLLEGEMKDAVDRALNLVMNNTDDSEVLKTAFHLIESYFPNSRIHSVHQMIYTIETQNTKNYTLSIDNMWLDIQAWVKRVTVFQRELKDRKTKLMILSLLTMGSNCLFVSMYTSNDIFKSFTDNQIYQVSSTFFMMALIILISVFQTKLNGQWLLDDKTVNISKNAMKSFQYIRYNRSLTIRSIDKIMTIISLSLGVFVFMKTQNALIVLLCFYLAYYFYTSNQRMYKNHMKHIKKFIQVEFPTWMRDVALNLQNLTVVNAIEASKKSSSLILCYYIDQFIKDVYDHPVSIKPFNDFLDEFQIDGVKSSMKVLYSLQSLKKEEMQKQTNYLIIRNQEMLDKSESIKNEDSMTGLKLMGFIPVAIFIAQMLISMGLLFGVMMNLMNSSMIL